VVVRGTSCWVGLGNKNVEATSNEMWHSRRASEEAAGEENLNPESLHTPQTTGTGDSYFIIAPL